MIYHDAFNNLYLNRKNTALSHQNSHQQTPSNSIGRSQNSSIDRSNAIFSRKMSTSSLKDYVNIDKLIGEIKLVPNKNSNILENINIITKSLNILKEVPAIQDQVRTIQLLLQSIDKKLTSNSLADTRSKIVQSSITKPEGYKKINPDVSPIKQFQDTSRIVYTNFSLKELAQVRNEDVYDSQNMQTPLKKYKEDREQNEQMQRLNNEIVLLQKMLRVKGFGNESEHKQKNKPLKETAKLFSSMSKNKLQLKQNIVSEALFKKSTLYDKGTKTSLNYAHGQSHYQDKRKLVPRR